MDYLSSDIKAIKNQMNQFVTNDRLETEISARDHGFGKMTKLFEDLIENRINPLWDSHNRMKGVVTGLMALVSLVTLAEAVVTILVFFKHP